MMFKLWTWKVQEKVHYLHSTDITYNIVKLLHETDNFTLNMHVMKQDQ